MKTLIFATHPIQYQVPIYRELAKKIDLTVVYLFKSDAQDQAKAGFNIEFEWDVPLLEGYDYIYLNNRSANPSTNQYRGIVLDEAELDSVFNKYRPDKVIVNGWFPYGLRQVLNYCSRKNVYVIGRGDSHLKMKTGKLRRLLKEILLPLILRKFNGFLVVGSANREFYLHYGIKPEKLGEGYHCINTPFFEERFSRAVPGRSDKIQIGFAGKLIDVKRPLFMLKALSASAYKDKIDLRVIGDGPLRDEMEKYAAANNIPMTMTGFLNQSEIVEKGYAGLDVLLLPSESETWGLVVNEVMTGGIPVIVSSRVGCHPDLVKEGETGYVFEVNSESELTAKIDLFIKEKQAGKDFSDAVKRKIAGYSLEATTNGFLKKLLGKN